MAENHDVVLTRVKLADGRWEVRVDGVTSGATIHFGDGDTGSITFRLDASRFTPRLYLR